MQKYSAHELSQSEYQIVHSAEEVMQKYTSRNDNRSFLAALNQSIGCLGMTIAKKYGGQEYSHMLMGNLLMCVAQYSPSLASLLTVHNMVAYGIQRWGSPEQQSWLSEIANGKIHLAFALSEPGCGSDMSSIKTKIELNNDGATINGEKTWISGAMIADMALCFGYTNEHPICALVPLNDSSVRIQAINDMCGFADAEIGKLQFNNTRVPLENLIGRPGSGLAYVANSVLDVGRFFISWLSLGITTHCLSETIHHTKSRQSFGAKLINHQFIQEHIAQLSALWRNSKLSCEHVAKLRAANDLDATMETNLTKYICSTSAREASQIALHCHGAYGLTRSSGLPQYCMDAMVTEIIEGSNEIQKMLISDYVSQCWVTTGQESLNA